MSLTMSQLTLCVILGTLAAIVYSLRILVLMERRVANVEVHIERLVNSVLREELKIEKAESALSRSISKKKK